MKNDKIFKLKPEGKMEKVTSSYSLYFHSNRASHKATPSANIIRYANVQFRISRASSYSHTRPWAVATTCITRERARAQDDENVILSRLLLCARGGAHAYELGYMWKESFECDETTKRCRTRSGAKSKTRQWEYELFIIISRATTTVAATFTTHSRIRLLKT